MLKPLMQIVLEEELKTHPNKKRAQEEKSAELGQKLLDILWEPEEKPATLLEKVKMLLSDGIDLSQKLFNRMLTFRLHQGMSNKKEEMQKVTCYAIKAFCKGTEILARGCYLFYHNPQAFEKYATTSSDFWEDVRQTIFNDEDVFMPILPVQPMASSIVARKAGQKYDGYLPLHSFAPVKYGQHPALITNQQEMNKYQGLFSELSLRGFSCDPSRYEPFTKLIRTEQSEPHYPALQHKAIVVALNEFYRHLEREPVKICTHKNAKPNTDKQHFNG